MPVHTFTVTQNGESRAINKINTLYRKPDQKIHPYMFGDDASKNTGLWLRGLPLLVIDPALRVPGRLVTWKGKTVERWANQTDSNQNNLTPSDDRWLIRSKTYPGIAKAFGQWGEPHELSARFGERQDRMVSTSPGAEKSLRYG